MPARHLARLFSSRLVHMQASTKQAPAMHPWLSTQAFSSHHVAPAPLLRIHVLHPTRTNGQAALPQRTNGFMFLAPAHVSSCPLAWTGSYSCFPRLSTLLPAATHSLIGYKSQKQRSEKGREWKGKKRKVCCLASLPRKQKEKKERSHLLWSFFFKKKKSVGGEESWWFSKRKKRRKKNRARREVVWRESKNLKERKESEEED